mgnify:CR=1 FL=1
MMKRVLSGLVLLLGSTAVCASSSYCLSSGRTEGYRCDTAQAQVSSWYSVQLLQRAGEPQVAEEDVLHRSGISESISLVYWGRYKDEAEAQAALALAIELWGERAKPLLVEFSPRKGMPRIRLVAEVEPLLLAAAAGRVPTQSELQRFTQLGYDGTPGYVAAPVIPHDDIMGPVQLVEEPQYSLVYSIQVGAFARLDQGQAFANQNREVPLYCRKKENGMFAVYYGVYQGFYDAKPHLGDHDVFAAQGAYVVKLKDVSFQPCDALSQSIREAKRKAYAPCKDCEASAIAESFLPEQLLAP